MWRQFYNLTRVGVQGVYISMFDEYNEGNQIAKTAEGGAWVPAGSGIRALDEDGYGVYVGLLPAVDQRRRPDVQGPGARDGNPAHAAVAGLEELHAVCSGGDDRVVEVEAAGDGVSGAGQQ